MKDMKTDDPLTLFVCWKWTPPYRAPHAGYRDQIMPVVPVRSKTGIVAAKRGGRAHLDNGVAAIFEEGHARYAARFLCRGGSSNVNILADAEIYGGICYLCVDAAAGPCVYRCFDASKALIYIGCAERWLIREQAHQRRTPWWPDVADVKVARYRTIFEACAAERLAIDAEKPLHNRPPGPRQQYLTSA